MDFVEISRKVFASYEEGAYEEALGVVRSARSSFPRRDSTLTFYEACLESLSGRPGDALSTLQQGVERGLFWHPRMLVDPDLDAVREFDGWEALSAECEAISDQMSMKRLRPLWRPAKEPLGTIVALHGAGHVPEDFEREWVDIAPAAWTVVAPWGEIRLSEEARAWPFDLSTASLREDLERVQLTSPIVLTGFSQGAALAAKAAWNGVVDAAGLILSAPSFPDDLWSASNRTRVPTYIVVGTKDRSHMPSTSIGEAMRQEGVPVHLDVREDLGHAPPPDLDQVIADGLAWISEQTAPRDARTDP